MSNNTQRNPGPRYVVPRSERISLAAFAALLIVAAPVVLAAATWGVVDSLDRGSTALLLIALAAAGMAIIWGISAWVLVAQIRQLRTDAPQQDDGEVQS